MKLPFLDTSYTSSSIDLDPSITVNLFPEILPPESKTQIALIARPGLTLVNALSGIARGVYVFNNLNYIVVGNQVLSFDGTNIVNLTTKYGWINLNTSTGPVTFTDNGVTPAGGNQILMCDGQDIYVLNINPQIYVNVNGDGVNADGSPSATLIPQVSGGEIIALNLPTGETSTGTNYTHASIQILGGNPSSQASATATLGGGYVSQVLVNIPGNNYTITPSVIFSPPTAVFTQNDNTLTLTTGPATTTIATGLFLSPGQQIIIYATAFPNTFSMQGLVTSYNSSTGVLVFNMSVVIGSGTTTGPWSFAYGQRATGTILNSNIVNGQIQSINLTNAGSGYITPPAITISGNGSAQATAVIAGGTIVGATMTNVGAGYGTPSFYVINNSGTTATASGFLGSAGISALSPALSGYAGYQYTPILEVSGGGGIGALGAINLATGSGALAIVTSLSGGAVPLTGAIQMINNGASYSQAPIVNFYGGGGSGAQGTAVISGIVTAVTLTNPGQYDFRYLPTVVFQGGGGSGAQAYVVLSGVTTGGSYPQAAIASVVITNGGSGYTSTPNVVFLNNTPASDPVASQIKTAIGTAQISTGVTGITMTSGGHSYTTFPNILLLDPIASIGLLAPGYDFTSNPSIIVPSVVNSATITGTTGTYTSPPTIIVDAPTGANPVNATMVYQMSGSLLYCEVTNGGTGYSASNPPTVVLSGGNGTIGLTTATATVNSTGQVSGVTFNNNNSSAFTLAPSASFTGGGGSGATATVIICPNNTVVITNPGSGYLVTPNCTVTGGVSGTCTVSATISTCTITPTLNYPLSYIDVLTSGSQYTDSPDVTIEDPTGTGATAIANVNNGMVTSIYVTDTGQNYSAPVIVISAPAGFPADQSTMLPAVTGISSVNFINGWGIISQINSPIFQVSDLYDFTIWPTDNYAAKTISNDPIVSVGIGSINSFLPLFGKATVELFSINAQNTPPFTFSSLINVGLAAQQSLVAVDNTFFWLGNANNQGKGEFLGIVKYTGSSAEIVSTNDINYAIKQMSVISDATAYSYTDAGHTFYVITFPTGNATWAYDISTKKWTRRSYNTGNNFTYGRELPQYHFVFNNKDYVTDYSNGNIYIFDKTNFTDNGTNIVGLRITSPIFDPDSLNYIQHDLLEIDLGSSVNTISAANAILSFSDDGGYTYTGNYTVSIVNNSSWGHRLRATWRMLGISKKRVYRLVLNNSSILPPIIAGYVTGSKLEI